jgi:hypothetical protein
MSGFGDGGERTQAENTLGEEPLKAGARIFATSRRPGRSGSLSFKRARARWAQNYAAWDDDTWPHGGDAR